MSGCVGMNISFTQIRKEIEIRKENLFYRLLVICIQIGTVIKIVRFVCISIDRGLYVICSGCLNNLVSIYPPTLQKLFLGPMKIGHLSKFKTKGISQGQTVARRALGEHTYQKHSRILSTCSPKSPKNFYHFRMPKEALCTHNICC